jgi:hypothetical protein
MQSDGNQNKTSRGRLRGKLGGRLRGLKAVEIEAKQYDKEGGLFFAPQNVTKKQAYKK